MRMDKNWSRLLLAIVFLASQAHADVELTHHITSNGLRGLGAAEHDQVRMIKGLRSRHEDQGKLTGAVLKKVTRDRHNITLTLLDKEQVVIMDVARKTYIERPIREEKAVKDKEIQEEKEEAASDDSPPTHKITKAEVKATPTNETKTINGFPCKKYLLEMLLEVENLETKERSQTRMLNTLWTTPETAALAQAQKEEQAFSEAYLKKLGVSMNPKSLEAFGGAMIASLMGAGEKELAQALGRVATETKKIKGYPIVTQVDWFLTETDAREDASSSSEESSVDLSGGVENALGGIAAGWAKKKVNKKMDERAKANVGKPAFSIMSELKTVRTTALEESLFEVPVGYKKIAH